MKKHFKTLAVTVAAAPIAAVIKGMKGTTGAIYYLLIYL